MEFLFLWPHPPLSIYGGTKELGGVETVHSFSLRVLFWPGKRRGLAGLLYIPPIFHLIWRKPGKYQNYLHKVDCVDIINICTWG